MKSRTATALTLALAAVFSLCPPAGATTVNEPPAYFVEWLGGDGNQQLDTEYIFKTDPRVETTMMLLSTADNDVGTEIAPKVLAREGETRRVRVTASASSYLTLSQDTTVGDIHLLDSTAKLYLKGYTLYVRTRKHAVSPNDASQVILGGGQIIWQQPETVIFIR